MTVSARDVAAVLRDRLPELSVKKLHKLLYYCQGHHLAFLEARLFNEAIYAWDPGPVVGALWVQEKRGESVPPSVPLGNVELNTIGYVLSRYGALTSQDLGILSRGEDPWQMANRHRGPRGSALIELEWMTSYFQAAGAPGDDEDIPLDSGVLRRWLADVASRPPLPRKIDSLDELRVRLKRDAWPYASVGP